MKKTKIHYRLYKAKPHWAFIAITTGVVALSFQVGANHVAHADTNDDQQQNVDQNATKLATNQTTASSATSAVQNIAAAVSASFDVVSSASSAINSTYAAHSDSSDVVNASSAALKAFNDASVLKSTTDSLFTTASAANAKVSAATSYSADVDSSVAVTTSAQSAASDNVSAINSIVSSITSLNAALNVSTPAALTTTTYSVAASSNAIGTVASNIATYDSYANRPHTVATTVEFTNGDSVVSSQTYYGYPGNDIAYQLDGPAGYSFVSSPSIKGSDVASTAKVAILPYGVVTVVKFVENGQLVGQRAYNTKPNTPIDYTADIEQGYHAVNGPTINSGTTSQTYTVNIERGKITTTLQFMHGNDVVGTRQFVGGTNSNIYLNGDVPAGYHAASDAPIYAGYADQTVQVQLIKDPVATNPGDKDDNGSNANGSAHSHATSKASSAHSHATSHASSASHSASSQSNGKVKYHSVKNTSKAKLPQTGESETARNMSILGLLMMVLSFGLFGAAKRKNKD